MQIDVYLNVIRRWLWLIVLMAVVAAGAAFLILHHQPTYYTASAQLLVGPRVNQTGPGASTQKGAPQAIQTYAALATTHDTLAKVVDDLHLTVSPNSLAGQITVVPNPDSQILNLTVRSTEQKEALAVVNSLAKIMVGLSSQADSTAPANANQLNAQAAQLQQQITDTQARITQLSDEYKSQGDELNGQAMTDQENKVQAMEDQLAAPTDPAVAKRMQDREARIQQLETSLKTTLTLDARKLILDEISNEDRLLASDRNLVNQQQRDVLAQLSQERNRLTSMQTSINQRQSQISTQLNSAQSELDNTQHTLGTMYPMLQSSLSRQLTPIQLAAAASPEQSKAPLISLAAGIAGLVLGLTVAFAYEFLDDRVKTPQQLVEATGIRVWGTIQKQTPLLRLGSSKGGALALPTSARVAEAFRQLCIKLTPTDGSSNVCSLLVSSLDAGDSSAEIAANLAITLTRSGKRVILIDGDLHHPTTEKLFQLETQNGLAHWLVNRAGEPGIVPVEWVPGLSVIPVGSGDGNSAQDLVWPRMQELLSRVESETDMVVVAGPSLSSADGFFLATHVGGVLVVGQVDKTHRKQAQETIDSLRSMGVQILGSILVSGPNRGFVPVLRDAIRDLTRELPATKPPMALPNMTFETKTQKSTIALPTFGVNTKPPSNAPTARTSGGGGKA